ncbi:Ser/Thr protein kinase RdoA (MazF antagonist) [Motilibacter rhizosphaerae]|uniref:Ser/Thr protein kinase RdoA (MazF antagonist) n=1 Tax=Motilibacter rhizosphaerae TaxID=598652 RepID=A0A4Q7NVA2_9ACTN|nr:phosphotransferase [Motilibacter rhizosphaerae]RZS90342.1 Ser/Thr protein kinase RdoA (MazF antagonist) [Motilibacter rhizosphaerae]
MRPRASSTTLLSSRTPVAPPVVAALPAARAPQRHFTRAEALAAAAAAAPVLGLAPSAVVDAEVVQVVSTAVLRVAGLAVKVYPVGTDAARLRAQAAALAGAGEHWVLPVAGPVETAYGVVTAYPWLPADAPVGWSETGALLAAYHAADVPTADLPRWTPLRRLPEQVAAYAAVPGADPGLVAACLGARERLLERVAGLRSELGVGAIHGDVSPANVLRRDGRPVLIDSDFVAVGPREYDLVPAAQRRERGAIDEGEYLAFCDAYGCDVRGWEGLGLVEELCGLGAVTFRLWCAVQRDEDTGWFGGALQRYVE